MRKGTLDSGFESRKLCLARVLWFGIWGWVHDFGLRCGVRGEGANTACHQY